MPLIGRPAMEAITEAVGYTPGLVDIYAALSDTTNMDLDAIRVMLQIKEDTLGRYRYNKAGTINGVPVEEFAAAVDSYRIAEAARSTWKEGRPQLAIADMVLWAKDRLRDDLEAFIYEAPANLKSYNAEARSGFDEAFCYGDWTEAERQEFTAALGKFAMLMALPDDSYDSLGPLSEHYWNGRDDTLWEEHMPPDDYEGQ